VTYRGKPILYVRVSRGGREAARAQERQIRGTLEAAGVASSGVHVYCDVDTPAHHMGNALGLLLEEATFRRVGTVIVQNLRCLGCYEVLMHALMTLDRGGAEVVVASELLREDRMAEQLRNKAPSRDTARVVLAASDVAGSPSVLPGDAA
jgi:hypothetical protein